MFHYISQRGQLLRAYYAGIGKTAVIFPSAFLVAVALGLLNLGLVFYASEVFLASASQVGLLLATFSLSYVFGCLVIRPRTDHLLPRYLTVISSSSMALITLSLQLVPAPEGLPALYFLHALNGLSLSHFWPPLMGWLSMANEGKALGRLFSRYNCAWCSGMIISPFLAGLFSDIWVRLPLFIGSGLFLLTATFMTGAALALPRVRTDRDTALSSETGSTDDNESSTPLRFPAWVGVYSSFFSMGVLAAVFPLIGKETLGLEKAVIGMLLLTRSTANALGFWLLGKTDAWHFRFDQMVGTQLVAAVIFFLMCVAGSSISIAVLLLLFGFIIAMSYSNSVFHGVSGSPNRAARMAIHESVLASGLVSGAAIGGMVYDAYSAVHLYALCASLFLGVALTQSIMKLVIGGNNNSFIGESS